MQKVKVLVLCFLGTAASSSCLGQLQCWIDPVSYHDFDFESAPVPEFTLFIDTIANQNNQWQVGTPQKPVISAANSSPNVIITDLNNPYSVGDTSSFIIKSIENNGLTFGVASMAGYYNVNCDSLNDFGMIEYSVDMGITWVDLLDPGLSFNWGTPKPVLTGNSFGWKYFEVGGLAAPTPINSGDTILTRFTFISDGNADSLDGLAFDNLQFCNYIEGIEELQAGKVSLYKVIDLMGRETEDKPNTLLIYIYSDGTTEKVFRIE